MPLPIEKAIPLPLGSSLNFRAASRATATGTVPSVNKSWRLWAEISDDASLERIAHPPQPNTAKTEYQNHGFRNIIAAPNPPSAPLLACLRSAAGALSHGWPGRAPHHEF